MVNKTNFSNNYWISNFYFMHINLLHDDAFSMTVLYLTTYFLLININISNDMHNSI